MITANTSTVRIVADVSKFVAELKTADGQLKAFDSGMTSLRTRALQLGGAMLAAAGVGGMGAMVARSMQLRDEQAKLADRLGITTQQAAAFSLQAELAGVGAQGFESALQKMVVKLQEAAERGGPVADAIESIGLNVYELASQRPDQAFFALSDAMRGMTDENQKLNVVTKIFGEAAGGVVNMLNEGRAGFESAARRAEEFGTAISRVDAQKIEAANDAMTLAKESVDGLATRITLRLSPVLAQMAENFARNSVELAKFFGFRTEEEELNNLYEKRMEIIERLSKLDPSNKRAIASSNAQLIAVREEIKVIEAKMAEEAAYNAEREKNTLAEQQATKLRLEHAAAEEQASKNKKAAIDAELQTMRDAADARKSLFEEMKAEEDERAIAEQFLRDQRVAGLVDYQNNVREINALMVEDERNKGQLISQQQAADNAAQIQRGEAAFATILGNVSAHNKTFFKIQKLYRMSKLAMEAPAAVADAFAWGDSWGGPPAGFAMAGIAAAAMATYGAQLASAQFGGGSSSVSAPGSGSIVTDPIRPGDTSIVNPPAQNSGSVTIQIMGDVIGSEDFVYNKFMPLIEEAINNRDYVMIRGDSRNGQILRTT